MFTTTQLRRSLALCAAVAAVLVAVPSATAAPIPQEQYYESQTIPAGPAKERYYSSYGESEPLSTPAAPGDGASWLPIALALAGGLILTAATATQVRRLRIRRRRAVGRARRP